MIAALALAAAAASPGTFKEAFPEAKVVEAPDGKTLASASGFKAEGLGDTPVKAAQAFLERYGSAFSVVGQAELVVRTEPAAGKSGAVRFGRRIDGLPVFDADVVVDVDAGNAVTLVNASPLPSVVAARRARVSRAAAVRAARRAIRNLRSDDEPRAERGFMATVGAVRPVWRVEFTATQPAGDYRVDVDAQTGRVLAKTNLRTDQGTGVARPSMDLGH